MEHRDDFAPEFQPVFVDRPKPDKRKQVLPSILAPLEIRIAEPKST
jgi:hypothetical protein